MKLFLNLERSDARVVDGHKKGSLFFTLNLFCIRHFTIFLENAYIFVLKHNLDILDIIIM